MPSYYDPAKNRHVGAMDEHQFYREADPVNAAYFEELLGRWTADGGQTKWGAGGVGLRASVEGNDTGICFLAPAFGKKKDRIELSLTPLAKRIGVQACAALKASLREAAGTRFKGSSMVSIVEPGELTKSEQSALSAALCRFLSR
ncbi:MAG: hypothetical protein ACE5GX_03090 [Thermoanaerobaculia bacterium]